ncbi:MULTISPECIES: IS3 family transposase [unclassified Bacillus (in: firmicutes)]
MAKFSLKEKTRAVRRYLNSNEGGKAIFAKYIKYYNHKRIKTKLKDMSSV